MKQEDKNESNQDESKATTSTIDLDLGEDNRATSPSNSSTHSSSAATNSGGMGSAADLMSNFNKAMAAVTGMSMFNNNADFAAQNPFAAFFGGSSANDDNNAFAQLLNGFNPASTPTPTSTPATPNAKPPSITSNATTLSASGSSRRANRTRFTDFQLRTLQDFFDKQAYPKDDDLEMLSKRLSLSPRVIVVWFQVSL